MTRLGLAAWTACLLACRYPSDTNAPGHIVLEEPPRDPTSEAMEPPADPGQRAIELSAGPAGGFGGGEQGFIGDFALEATLNRIEGDSSEVGPDRGYGVTLGWSALRLVEEQFENRIKTGPIYVEAQQFYNVDFLVRVGLGSGWVIQPTNADHGPQFSVWILGGAFARVRYLLDGGAEVYMGLQLKIPATWLRYR